MDRLVTVDAKELEIHFRPSQRCTATFRVTNLMHTMSVAVHLTTTRPNLFSLSPQSFSLLPPLSSSTFSLLLLPSDRPPLVSPPDVLIVRSTLLPTGKADRAHLLRLFSRPGVHVFRDANLPISLLGPHVLDSLLLPLSPQTLNSKPPSETLETAFLLSKALSACSPSDLAALLRRSAAAGKPRFVSALVSAGADVHGRDSDQESPLSLAVSSGNAESVKILVNAGSRIDPSIDRVMHEAAASNRTDLMLILTESGRTAWADAADSTGRTPLHVAAFHGHMDAVRLCVSSGDGDPDRTDENGWTPLHCAASGGFLEIVEFLIDRSNYAKYALTRDGRKTPFDLANDHGHTHLYDVLRLGDSIHRAASSGDVSTVRSCLSQGAEVDRRDQNGWTPLHRAAFKGRIEVVKVLIDHGAKLDAADHAGYTPLRCAADAGHAEVALCLVSHGARVGLKGLKGANWLPVKLDCCANAAIVPSLCGDNIVEA